MGGSFPQMTQVSTDPVSLKPATSTENPTLELFGGPLSVLFGAFHVVQSVLPINAGFIWQINVAKWKPFPG